jgi:ribonuclease P protein component
MEARLGLAVSRRVGGAVVRNRVKRRVREWFRHRRGLLAGLDLVVTARPAAAALDQFAVARTLEALLSRLRHS